jgi:hypothetical protein
MHNLPVTSNDIAQALSKTLLDVSMGRDVNKSKLEKQIDIADALNRRMQTKINVMKVMIEAKKHGIDFAASMTQINQIVKETGEGLIDFDEV